MLRLHPILLLVPCLLIKLATHASAQEEQEVPLLALCMEISQLAEQQQTALSEVDDTARQRRSLGQVQIALQSSLIPKVRVADWSGARQVVEPLLRAELTPELEKLLTELMVAIQAEEQARKEQILTDYQQLQERVGAQLLSYREASELDQPIQELRQIVGQFSTVSSWQHGERPSESSLISLLETWQEFLYFRQKGDLREAKDKLKRATSTIAVLPDVPRSRLIEMRDELDGSEQENLTLDKANAIIDELNGPATYDQIYRELELLFNLSNRNYVVSKYRDIVARFMAAQGYIDQGNAMAALEHMNHGGWHQPFSTDPRILAERDRLTMSALSLGLEQALQPHEGETVIAYVDRVARAMGEQARWQEQWEFLDAVAQSRALVTYSVLHQETSNSSKLIAGNIYEGVGDYLSAYAFYSDVIDSPSSYYQAEGAQAGIMRLMHHEPDISRLAAINKQERDAYREYFRGQLYQGSHGGPPNMPSDTSIKKIIDDKVKEAVALEVQRLTSNSQKAAADASPPKPVGKRFEVTYLDEHENIQTEVYDRFYEGGTPFLRFHTPREVDFEDIWTIEIESPVTLEEMKKWPAKYENRKDIPTTTMKVRLLSGETFEDQMYSTLYLKFSSSEGGAGLSLHPPRILSIRRVP